LTLIQLAPRERKFVQVQLHVVDALRAGTNMFHATLATSGSLETIAVSPINLFFADYANGYGVDMHCAILKMA
jgi:hypothetical protein